MRRESKFLSKIANLGAISALLGIILLFGLPVGHFGLYISSTCLLLGAILGLAYTLRPKLKPTDMDMIPILSLEYLAFVGSSLKYFKVATFTSVALAFIPLVLTIGMMVVAKYRDKK